MMISHQNKEVGMATRLDILKQQLEELEIQKALWRKQCEDEERRMALDFERELAEMDKKFSDAMEKIELDFEAKKEALMCKNSGKGVRAQSTTARFDSCYDQTQLKFACANPITMTTSQPNFVAPRTQLPQPLSAVCDENNGIPHTVPIVSTTNRNHSNQNQSTRSVQLAADTVKMDMKQSTVNVAQECALVKKAPVVVVSVERNAVSRCVVFDPGGALYRPPHGEILSLSLFQRV